MKKARTARYFNMDSSAIGELSQPGGALYNIEHSNNGLITFPGGIPIKNSDGNIIGAIGVSGSTVEDDHAVASRRGCHCEVVLFCGEIMNGTKQLAGEKT